MNLDGLLGAIETGGGGRPKVIAWSLYASESRQLALGIKDREAGNAHAPMTLSEAGGLSYLLVWEDGLVSRGGLERVQYQDNPAEALDRTRAAAYSDPDAAHVAGSAELPDVVLHDPGAAAVAGGDTGPFAARLDELRRRIDEAGVKTWSGSFSAAETRSRLITSAGFDAEGRGTSIGWHATLDGRIGDGFSARAAEDDAAFRARVARLLELSAELRREAASPTGGMLPILLHPRVVAEYVLDTLLSNLEGAAVAHGSGAFSAEQFDGRTPVFREDLGLRVDPLLPLRSGSYRFTSEGVPACRCTFIEGGCLVRPVLGLKYAHRLGLPPTALPAANDTLRFEGSPPIGLDAALDLADGGVVVLSVLGVHTQDATSGDFSLSAPQVLAVRNGALAGRLVATLSGNLFELLRDPGVRWVAFEGETTPGLLYRGRLDPR